MIVIDAFNGYYAVPNNLFIGKQCNLFDYCTWKPMCGASGGD